ncbi:MAG: peptidylprolyl isomerase [Fimbriimonadaceae bacterium]|nr:peptidylprolyl isomerase [Chitinophagales bacterium]
MKVLVKKISFIILLCVTAQASFSQTNGKDPVLFSVAGQPVTKSEFMYVYQKNNPNKKNDFSKASLQEYLDLYINFKLKVTEARAIQIDTTAKVRDELEKYGDQLIKSNFDKEVMDAAVQQHYNRMQNERQVSHIMITLNADAKPEDTLVALSKITAAQERLKKGEDFAKVAGEISSDPNAKDNGGLLGWMTGYSIPDMNFEDAAYNTKVGDVSNIVRSKYGYHIIKVNQERPASGQVKVAHILIKPKNLNNNPATPDLDGAKAKADSISNLIASGQITFEDAVSKFSDDNTTKGKDGALEIFGVGRMVPPFETAAFALKNVSDISAPVKTNYGYHILKLLEKKPVAGLEDSKADIRSKIERSDEYNILRRDFVAKAKAKYNFKEYPENKNELIAKLDSSFINSSWKMYKAAGMNKPLFSLSDKTYTQKDMAGFIDLNQKAYRDKDITEKYNKMFKQASEQYIIEYDLSTKNEDFRRLMQEYRDGIPLFALLEQKVWTAAAKDTLGLEKYYEEHKSEYMWDERADAKIYRSPDEATAKEVRKLVQKDTPDSIIINKFIIDSVEAVSIESGLYLAGQNSNIDKLNKQPGLGENILGADGSVTFVKISKMVPSQPKTLKEARGYVISNYQDHLEKKWIEDLKAKYSVKVNEDVFNSMVK